MSRQQKQKINLKTSKSIIPSTELQNSKLYMNQNYVQAPEEANISKMSEENNEQLQHSELSISDQSGPQDEEGSFGLPENSGAEETPRRLMQQEQRHSLLLQLPSKSDATTTRREAPGAIFCHSNEIAISSYVTPMHKQSSCLSAADVVDAAPAFYRYARTPGEPCPKELAEEDKEEDARSQQSAVAQAPPRASWRGVAGVLKDPSSVKLESLSAVSGVKVAEQKIKVVFAKPMKKTAGIAKLRNMQKKLANLKSLDTAHCITKNNRKSWIKTVLDNRFNRNDKSPFNSKKQLHEGCLNFSKILNMSAKGSTYNDQRYEYQKSMFLSMTQQQIFETPFDIVYVILSNNNEQVISLSKSNNTEYAVNIYHIEQNQCMFYLDIKGENVKAVEIQQNSQGSIFALPYSDGGRFFMIIFDKSKLLHKVDFMNIKQFEKMGSYRSKEPSPMINCTFLDSTEIFVNIYHPPTKTNWHFTYSVATKTIVQFPVSAQMNFRVLNFPIGCFFDKGRQEINVFYRRGDCLSTARTSLEKPFYKSLPEAFVFEEAFMHENETLIIRHSKAIYFYQQTTDADGKVKWSEKLKLKKPGRIYYKRGWMTVTINDVGVEYYKFDSQTKLPILVNTVGNLYSSTHVIYRDEPKNNLCLTYQQGTQDFQIEKRKYQHSNRVILDDLPHSNSLAVDCKTIESFVISQGESLVVYSYDSLKPTSRIKIPIQFKKTGMQDKILSIKLCQSERYLAILLGNKTDEDCITSLLIYEQDIENQTYNSKYQRLLPRMLEKVCKEIEFFNQNVNEIIFTDFSQIFRYNYVSEEFQVYFDFSSNLNCQPEFVVSNRDLRIVMIASFYDVVWVNLDTKREIDIDNYFQIGGIRSIINDNSTFYILSNKSKKRVGYFLIQFDERSPIKIPPSYVINQPSNSDIGHASLHMCVSEGKRYLVVGQKTMKNNVYNLFVVDLQTRNLIFRNEMFSLWESGVKGLLISSNEFIFLAEDGISVLSIFPMYEKRPITDSNSQKWMLHSMKSCNYLKISETNHILIKEQASNQIRSISIQEQHEVAGNTQFTDIYKIRIQNMSLIELMLFQSIFASTQQSYIAKLIQQQPNPKVFFKSFDEIDMSNMVTILAYDTRPIKILLDDKNEALFGTKYPLFYNYKHQDPKGVTKYQSAIDIALEANQIRAITLIIDYIIKYQNSYIFSYLFKSNLIKLINRGVPVSPLLQSDVFEHQFEFENWPQIHTNDEQKIELYNGSKFHLRSKYSDTFPNFKQEDQIDSKVYKIKYTLNILPSIDELEDSLMNALGETEELEIFQAKVIRDLIHFRWRQYAGKYHYIGLAIHTVYVIIFNVYVSHYLQLVENPNDDADRYKRRAQCITLNISMACCLIYPLIYDMTQLSKAGFRDYFGDKWNHVDQLNIWAGFSSVIIQVVTFETASLHLQRLGDCVLILVTMLMLIKTFFYLRIFSQLSYIVTMMKNVFFDLRVFMLFYLILILMFSIVLGILKVGNMELLGDPATRKQKRKSSSWPNKEYMHLPYFMSNIMTVTRISLGDFDFSAPTLLDPFQNIIFWLVWYCITIMTCIIFLNFIIAEVSSSYESVKSEVQGLILKERALMIKESEDMMPDRQKKNEKLFPRYLIMREQED